MRPLHLGLALALFLGLACETSLAPSGQLAGTWAQDLLVPGASLVLTIGNDGSGTGTYAIEAGRSGTIAVAGTVANGQITWQIRYDYGLDRTFTGSLVDARHIAGRFADGSAVVTFTRR